MGTSDTTSLYGGFYVDITGTIAGGGTIMPLGGSINWAVNPTPGALGIPGLYAPADTAPAPAPRSPASAAP